ncbi:MAG: twin transmembrane helix small protein [Gammaproteobacteria bacterium]|nr:twin transmembrane helix small protein [Gammaproteobacteria bacterium]
MAIMTLLIMLGMLATLATLATGITSMGHGGVFDRKHEVQLMSTRVALQAITVLLVLLTLYIAAH